MQSRVLRRCAAAGAALLVVLAGCGGEEGPPKEAGTAVTDFASAWSAGRTGASVASQTRKAAAAALTAGADQLGIRSTRVRATGAVSCLGEEQSRPLNADRGVCRQRLAVSHQLAGLGTWTYRTTAEVREDPEGRWKVWWTPATFHPKLTGTTTFERHRELPPRASILDHEGQPLTEDRPVVRIGVEPRKADPNLTYAKLGQYLGVDPGALRKRAEAAPPTQFVDVIIMREASYDQVATAIEAVPGVVTQNDTMSLAPSASYARGVLGVVAAATAETLKEAGPLALAGDEVGASGLQRAYQKQLAGRPGGSIDLVDMKSGDQVATVFSQPAKPGKPLRTSLDQIVQEAAEHAVVDQQKPTAIVAVRASTGEVLAAANGPGVTSYNRAFVAQYPPGSTFKVVSVAALLEGGLTLDERVTCPSETSVGGKRFKNANSFSLADGPMLQAFAHSCNTTVVDRAETLEPGQLVASAKRFGIGEQWKLGLPAYSGSVPEPNDLVDTAASMIGQGRVLMSPLGMALVAAAVDSGQPRTPVLLPQLLPGRAVGDKLPASLHNDLKAAMRAVVESGSAKDLDLLGEPVHAKTGTAEYGNEEPPRTHAWMIGFRGDVAFAVVIEDGGGGGRDAGPVAKRFLQVARFVR